VKKFSQSNVIATLVGTKTDLAQNRKISEKDAREFAQSNDMHYMEVSSKDGSGVDALFENLLDRVMA